MHIAQSADSKNGGGTAKQASMGVAATRGVFWIGGGQVFRQVLGIITSIVLARLLGPGDFGLIAMAYVFIELGQLFADFGIGAAVVQSRNLNPSVLSSAFWANVAVGLGLMFIILIAAPAVGTFYADARVGPVLAALSFTLLLSGVVVVPRAMLHKHLRFDLSVKAQMAGSFVGTVVAIALALSGAGVWSLVAQPVCGSTVTLLFTLRYAGWRPRREFSWDSIRHIAKFSTDVLGSSLAGYVVTNADKMLVGKVLGSAALGLYSLGFQLMLYPMTHVASVIVKVLFPTLSALQDELPRYRAAYLKSTAAIALFTFPIMMGLYIVSEDFVTVVFGEKWLEMVPVLQVLCFVGMFKSVATTVGTIYLSMARTRAMLYISLVGMPLSVAAFVIGLPWGIVGVASGYAVTSLLLLYVYLAIAFRTVHLRFSEFHASLIRPLTASLVMTTAVWLSHAWLLKQTDFGAQGRLALCVVIGGVVYVLMSLLINRKQVDQLVQISRAALKPRRGAATE